MPGRMVEGPVASSPPTARETILSQHSLIDWLTCKTTFFDERWFVDLPQDLSLGSPLSKASSDAVVFAEGTLTLSWGKACQQQWKHKEHVFSRRDDWLQGPFLRNHELNILFSVSFLTPRDFLTRSAPESGQGSDYIPKVISSLLEIIWRRTSRSHHVSRV